MHDRELLIRRLLGGMVDHPNRVELSRDEVEDGVKWIAKVDARDYGKACGAQGSHVRALTLLVVLMAKKDGEWSDFRLSSPVSSERGERVKIPDAKAFDAGPTLQLAHETVANLLEEPAHLTVEASNTAPIQVCFTITPRTHGDLARLLDPVEDKVGELNAISALGTLFRAIGRQRGVHLRLVSPPK